MGLPAENIKLLGDWASDAYWHYLDHDLDLQLSAMQQFVSPL